VVDVVGIVVGCIFGGDDRDDATGSEGDTDTFSGVGVGAFSCADVGDDVGASSDDDVDLDDSFSDVDVCGDVDTSSDDDVGDDVGDVGDDVGDVSDDVDTVSDNDVFGDDLSKFVDTTFDGIVDSGSVTFLSTAFCFASLVAFCGASATSDDFVSLTAFIK
jgi:hypothetical protein